MRIAAACIFSLLTVAPVHRAEAYEFLCRSWRITGYFGNGCPAGSQQSDACGCASHQPHTAPKWFNAQLAMSVENQGGNGITAAQFVQASQESAQAWTNVSHSLFVLTANQVIPANNNAPWGTNSSQRGVYYITTESEWISVTGSGAGGTLGIALAPYSFYSCTDRTFTDGDIVINGFIWGGWTYNGVKSTIMHEMGHVVGLGHPCLMGTTSSCSNSCQAIMGATGGNYIVPQQDDANGLAALYPGTPGGLGFACTSNSDCTSGPCITYDDFSYCSQSCGSCPDGYVCREVSPHGNVCTRQGAPQVGEPCTSICADGAICLNDGYCHALCSGDAQCEIGERCAPLQGGGGVCVEEGQQQSGEPCGGAYGDCAPGNICLLPSGGGTVGSCYRQCNASIPTSCGSGYLCVDYGGGLQICEVAAGENEVCTSVYCEHGLVCAGDGTGDYRCRMTCNPSGDDTCGPTSQCLSLGGGGGACFPGGDAQEGDSCLSGSDCSGGLLCVGTGVGGAQCYHECNGSGDCPWTGQSCNPLSGGGGFCSPVGGDGTNGGNGGTGGTGGTNGTGGSTQPPVGVCSCDRTTECDPDCPCDPECVCECDLTTACDANCPCDPECEEQRGFFGCSGAPGSGLFLWGLAAVWLRRRRRLAWLGKGHHG